MLPNDFVKRMQEQLNDSEGFFEAYKKPYIKSLRINTLKNPDYALPGLLDFDKEKMNDAGVLWEQRGFYYYEKADLKEEGFLPIDSPGKSPLHAAGAYYIQEASAMIPVTRLDVNDKGLKVLDLCAAPGGKTTQIADYMRGKGILVANEIIPSRAKILSENIERMGVTNALVISEDPHKVAGIFPGFFDRILVDAPCSGEGMFRKHNEAMEEWSLENVEICADRQDDILDCAARMLSAGGIIVYSTCTFSVEEDEACVDRFLERHPEFARSEPDERIFPHRDKGEGHFAAVLRYKHDLAAEGCRANDFSGESAAGSGSMDFSGESAAPDSSKGKSSDLFTMKQKKSRNKKDKKNNGKDISSDMFRILFDFCSKYIRDCDFLGIDAKSVKQGDFPAEIKDRLIVFGERIFLTPYFMPNINGVTVLRPGLALGKVIKDRFEPDHALALAMKKEHALLSVDYPEDSSEIHDYLRGGTIRKDCENGWYLICTRGLSVGWGKCANGCIKNHYPKGLRIQD